MRVPDQPAPAASRGDLWRDVVADMEERRSVGIERYGTPLQPFNGRNPMVDAYQESLDMVVYLRQAMEEFSAMRRVVEEARAAVGAYHGDLEVCVAGGCFLDDLVAALKDVPDAAS